ncbi:MAG: hypothetical protein CL484_12875 [Acidobacteria bacterium]|nr:hypothetical protein [Acidobacteriota bacterium]|tara:strand:+ start:2224 stop:3195 length:972 start_codon:yes stop_codon:yes gene_type:complete
MKYLHMLGLDTVATILAMVSFLPSLAGAQIAEPPKTAWGQPDLQGVWDFRTITPLQRPEQFGDRAFLTTEEAATLELEAVSRDERLLLASARRTEAGGNVGAYNNFWMDRGTRTIETRRTSLIVDPPNGRMPQQTVAGAARADARREYRANHPADSWSDRSTFDRCILGFNTGPPMTPGGYNQNMQVFQTEDHVVILNEMVHDSRIILLNGSPRSGIESWTGESRGHWEGDTLVIETTNFTDKTRWRGSTSEMTLVERLTRQDDDTLVYEFTVNDPNTWRQPWSAEIPMRLGDQPLFEYACHEGNYSMEGILSGARADERAVP